MKQLIFGPYKKVGAPELRFFLKEMLIRVLAALEKVLCVEPWEGPGKGERNASLLMAAPGSVEGRDTGRVGFNGGSAGRGVGGGGEGEGRVGRQTAWPLSSLEDSQTALETQDVGMQAGRTGLDTPSNCPPSTHTKTHTIAFSPFLS